ncbi:hypothetical protein GCM10022419_114760 [Nonomuraea rosea]|uniref:Uncharacterized protein n=1 Tax=Nonomuraea rosea TaxID=638574 RepID=A0ABP6ZKZ6_9ACTN
MTLSHQIAVPAQDGVRPDEESQPAQNLAWQRCQEGGEEGPVLRGESHLGVGAELPFKNRDLMTQGQYLDVLVPIAHRWQSQRSERVRDGQVGQAKEHSRSSCRNRLPLLMAGTRACHAKTWADAIIGRRTDAVSTEPIGKVRLRRLHFTLPR